MAEAVHIVRRSARPTPGEVEVKGPGVPTKRERRLSVALATVLSVNVFVVSTLLSLGFLLFFLPR